MKKSLLALCVAVLALTTSVSVKAKPGGGNFCADRNKHKGAVRAKTTTADPGEGNYDVKHWRFNLHVSDTSIYIDPSDVTTTAQVIATTMPVYVFELGTTMIIDSAKVDGVLLPVTTTGTVRKITLPTPLAAGTMFTAQIYYHGMPPTGSGFFNGITHTVSGGGTHMVYTVSDPWVGMNWWPTKQSVNDQADSVDMFVTVPAGVLDGSCGKLVNIDVTSTPGYWTHHWKTNYPIDYYLISIAVSRYSEYKTYMHFTGSADSMLIQNFFHDTATFNPAHKAKFDSVQYMIDYFSTLYGRYPFWREKYGMCFTTLSGGMEHQTMTTIGVTDTKTIAHELTHQWFGDHVTYKTWGDMWLSEGFATYGESVYFEKFWGAAKARSHRLGFISSAQSQPCGRTYVTDTSTSDSLFTVNQYPKAAMIVHMLRYIYGNDSTFFAMLRAYQAHYAFGNASTADFKAAAEGFYGHPLDTFFNQWIYGRGFPIYKATWNQKGSTVYVKLIQTPSCPSYTKHFSTPIEINLRAGSVDTFIKVYNNVDTQMFSFEWSPSMTNMYLNTNAQTMLKISTVTKDASLGMGSIERNNIRILPNPSKNYWEVDQLPEDTGLALMDMTGRILWEGKSMKTSTLIPGEKLPAGNYILRLSGGVNDAVKLVHW